MSDQNLKIEQQTPKKTGSWNWTRRRFFKNVVMSGLATQTTFIHSCIQNVHDSHPLTDQQHRILAGVQEILFPEDEYGPGAKTVNADKYVIWMLNDPRLDPEEKDYLLDGLDRLEEASMKNDQLSFMNRSKIQKEQFIQHILSTSWGESWLSVNLTYIFEAMVSDPIYGFNIDEKGWQWLNHYAGLPRPELHTMYDTIFETLKSRDL
jgi:gluconate 2-dehydrogenase gamma chain